MPSELRHGDACTNSQRLIILVVELLSRVQLFVTPRTGDHQASLSITNSQSLLKLISIESVMPSNHLILCCLLLLLPSIFPSIRVFSNESALHIRWPKDWSFRTMLSNSGKSGHPCLVPDLRGNAFSFSPLRIMFL